MHSEDDRSAFCRRNPLARVYSITYIHNHVIKELWMAVKTVTVLESNDLQVTVVVAKER